MKTDSFETTAQKIIKDSIRTIADFPKEGIMFRDISTLLSDKRAFCLTINELHRVIPQEVRKKISFIMGIEARGFIFASILANKLEIGLKLIRKEGKLPAVDRKKEVVTSAYQTEYSNDVLEILYEDYCGKQVLIVDDLLATGGSMKASCKLVEMIGGVVAGCLFVVELPDLKGREKLKDYNVVSLVKFEGK